MLQMRGKIILMHTVHASFQLNEPERKSLMKFIFILGCTEDCGHYCNYGYAQCFKIKLHPLGFV